MMEQLADFQWIETVGWLATGLTVATYAMNTMMPLRILAIASSVCFGIYAAVLMLWPLLVMELILLPINVYRFWQLLSLRKRVTRSRETPKPDFSVVKTYGKKRTTKAGEVIFRRGDPVGQLYFLEQGRVEIEEFAVSLSGGEIFGEIAFFTDNARRTATARCTKDAVIYELDENRFMRLQFEDPSFGLSVMRLITKRLQANATVSMMPQKVTPLSAHSLTDS